MGRTDKFKYGLAKEKRLAQMLEELNWSAEDHKLAEELLGESTGGARSGSGDRAES